MKKPHRMSGVTFPLSRFARRPGENTHPCSQGKIRSCLDDGRLERAAPLINPSAPLTEEELEDFIREANATAEPSTGGTAGA